MQDPNPPLTAKQAALLGAKADKPPFNLEADRRHVIASIIRRAGEAMGNSQQSTEAADAIQFGAPGSNQSQTQTIADWTTPVDSWTAGDLSLAQIIAADRAAERGFPSPPATPAADRPSLALGSSMDALQAQSWMAGAFDSRADSFESQPALPELAGFIDASMSPDIAQGSESAAAPYAFPPLENFQYDASALGPFNAPAMDSTPPPDVSDLLFRYDTADPGSISQLPYRPADEPAGPKNQMLPCVSIPDTSPDGENRVPITYAPFGQSGPSSKDT